MHWKWVLSTVFVMMLILSGCGSGERLRLQMLAETELEQWADAHRVTYTILEHTVVQKNANQAEVAMLLLVTDVQTYWGEVLGRYASVSIAIEQVGREWRVQPLAQLNNVLDVQVLSADSGASHCLNEASRTAQLSPCLRITNQSQFEIAGTLQVITGLAIRPGLGGSVDLGPSESMDLAFVESWSDNTWRDPLYVEMYNEDDMERLVIFGDVLQ